LVAWNPSIFLPDPTPERAASPTNYGSTSGSARSLIEWPAAECPRLRVTS
jgi:hypothetical protein